MSRTYRTLVATSIAVTLIVVAAVPASAVDEVINGTGIVHAGYYPDTPILSTGDDLDAHAVATGHAVSLGGAFQDVTSAPGPDADTPGEFNSTIQQLNEVWSGESTPWVNLLVGDASAADIRDNQSVTGQSLTGAPLVQASDEFIRRWAQYLERWLNGENLTGENVPDDGRSLVIAPLPEMNTIGEYAYQCQAAAFAAAYNRVVSVVKGELSEANRDNVRWAFAPNNTSGGCGTTASYYPGDATVDFMAFSGFNFYKVSGTNQTPAQVMDGVLATLKGIAPTKPIVVSQTASCDTNETRATWINQLFSLLLADFHVVGLVWFNMDSSGDGECDWRVWDGATADSAWDSALNSAAYAHPIGQWFVPDTTLAIGIVDTPDPCPEAAVCDSVALIDASGPNFNLYLRATLLSPRNQFVYGNPGDFALTGDWNCNNVDTPGQYRQSDGFVYLRNSNTAGNASRQFFLGNPGDIPIAGDFNGDGCDTISVYRPSTQEFFIANELADDGEGIVASFPGYVFGNPGDKPFAGDLDGDDKDEVGLHRESTGLVYYRNTLTTGFADVQFIFGDPGDIISAGDWNGNGTDTVAVYRPTTGTVYLKLVNQQGNADVSFFGGINIVGFSTAPRTAP